MGNHCEKPKQRREKLQLTRSSLGPSLGREPEPTAHSSPGESAPTGQPLTGLLYNMPALCVPGVSLLTLCDYTPTADSWSSSLTFMPEWLWWSMGRQGS